MTSAMRISTCFTASTYDATVIVYAAVPSSVEIAANAPSAMKLHQCLPIWPKCRPER